ncbi:MAG: hypothetical protein V4544_07180 [Pseudomonadota bacterium]
MKKILMMGAVFLAMTSVNASAMGAYGYGMPSGYGQQPQSAAPYGMGVGMNSMGGGGYPQPGIPQQGMPSQGGTNALTQDVKNSLSQIASLPQDIKGEAAFAIALKVSLNEAVICLTFAQNGQIFRLHSNSRNNGIVTDPGEIQNFNNMLNQAKQSPTGTATVQSSIVSNGQPETFIFDVMAIDPAHLVVVRHK